MNKHAQMSTKQMPVGSASCKEAGNTTAINHGKFILSAKIKIPFSGSKGNHICNSCDCINWAAHVYAATGCMCRVVYSFIVTYPYPRKSATDKPCMT